MTLEEIITLIDRHSETPRVDAKAGFPWKKAYRDHQLGLVRDMIAMANTRDGGAIVLGVENTGYTVVGLSEEVKTSLDPSAIGEILKRYADPMFQFELHKTQISGKDVAVIRIPEFEEIPILCKQSVESSVDSKRLILRSGAIYIRTEAAQTMEISVAEDMRKFLSRAMLKQREQLLHSIDSLMKFRPAVPSENESNQYQRELTEADQSFINALQKGFLQSSRWEVIAHPTAYKKRVMELRELKGFVANSQVNLRGWPFPDIDHEKAGNFNSGYQSYTDHQDKREGFRLYNTGLFVWKGTMSEELHSGWKQSLDVVSTIWRATEIWEFLKRLYEIFPAADDLSITIRLVGCQGRILRSSDYFTRIFPWHRSSEDTIEINETLQEAELAGTSDEMARAMARHIFAVFNWMDISEDLLMHQQDKLYGRSGQRRSS
jgi:hypothetical protein